MKPTILILLLLAALAVSGCHSSEMPLIVREVELCSEPNQDIRHKYHINVNGDLTIATDSLYQVGDTIK